MRPPLPPFITYPVKTASVLKISLERFSQPPPVYVVLQSIELHLLNLPISNEMYYTMNLNYIN